MGGYGSGIMAAKAAAESQARASEQLVRAQMEAYRAVGQASLNALQAQTSMYQTNLGNAAFIPYHGAPPERIGNGWLTDEYGKDYMRQHAAANSYGMTCHACGAPSFGGGACRYCATNIAQQPNLLTKVRFGVALTRPEMFWGIANAAQIRGLSSEPVSPDIARQKVAQVLQWPLGAWVTKRERIRAALAVLWLFCLFLLVLI
jgi:hypothetical protein